MSATTTSIKALQARVKELEAEVKRLRPLQGTKILIKATVLSGPDEDGEFYAETECGTECVLERDDFTLVDE
jgi:hypothetical protein